MLRISSRFIALRSCDCYCRHFFLYFAIQHNLTLLFYNFCKKRNLKLFVQLNLFSSLFYTSVHLIIFMSHVCSSSEPPLKFDLHSCCLPHPILLHHFTCRFVPSILFSAVHPFSLRSSAFELNLRRYLRDLLLKSCCWFHFWGICWFRTITNVGKETKNWANQIFIALQPYSSWLFALAVCIAGKSIWKYLYMFELASRNFYLAAIGSIFRPLWFQRQYLIFTFNFSPSFLFFLFLVCIFSFLFFYYFLLCIFISSSLHIQRNLFASLKYQILIVKFSLHSKFILFFLFTLLLTEN